MNKRTDRISVIVPVYNDPDGISTTLDSLLSQSTSRDFHINVIDNGSTDCTPETIQAYTDDRVSLYYETNVQSSYAARNTGVQKSEGNILAFVDADMTVPSDWLDSAINTFETTDSDYMGCNVELVLPENPTLAARYDHHTGFPVQKYLEKQHFSPTCCLLVHRHVFSDIGLFDHRLESGGDKEFGQRTHVADYDQHFAADVTMYHPVRESVHALITKDRRVGRGLCQLQRYHPDRFGTPGIPPGPSGIKRPNRDLPAGERTAFSLLSQFLTGIRGIGYYEEYFRGKRKDRGADSVPELDS